MKLPPIAVTTVGSLPRPGWLGHQTDIDMTLLPAPEVLQEALDDATLLALREQEAAGIDLVTDGEQRRSTFINHILESMEGFDFVERREKSIRRNNTRTRLVPRVVGPVRRKRTAATADLAFVKAHSTLPVKMAVPGPLTVVDTTFDEYYHDEAALAMDVAAAINAELLDLQAAGCDVLQIDEPAMTRYHEKTAEFAARALDRCLEGVTAPTFVHLCYGYPRPGQRQHHYTYPELLEVLMGTKISGFSLEFARSGYDPAILKGCGDRLVMYGCVNPGEGDPESVELVASRIRGALNYIDPSRLLIAPDCGLMTESRESASAKMALLSAAARVVRAGL
ncbi:MAG: hypothetical protein EXR51_03730 [Dehalococcoidia bacterium]|nr:hypothetical protein [Dehalococcoidia bacterium]